MIKNPKNLFEPLNKSFFNNKGSFEMQDAFNKKRV